jgi:hypothetical protein
MKKISIVFLCLLLSAIQVIAQGEFAPLGAKWTYHATKISAYVHYKIGAEQLSIYECMESNLINGHEVKKIKEITYMQKLSREVSGVHYFDRDTIIKYHEVYQDGDTVYYNNPIFQRYTPLYVFNVQDGDTLHLPITDTNYMAHNNNAGDSIMSIVIDSVRMVDYDGTNLKTYYTTSLYDSILWQPIPGMFLPVSNTLSNWSYESLFKMFPDPQGGSNFYGWMKGGYTELWGGLGGGLTAKNYQCYPESTDEENNPYLTPIFNCYQQNNTNIFMNTFASCDSLMYNAPLGLNNLSLSTAIEVFPNPAKEVLHLKVNTDIGNQVTVSVINMLGKVVVPSTKIRQGAGQDLDIIHLPSGLYILQIESEGRKGYQKIVVR